jgi:hypothetical protein
VIVSPADIRTAPFNQLHNLSQCYNLLSCLNQTFCLQR